MKSIHITKSGYYVNMPDGTIITKECAGTDAEKRRMAEEDIKKYSPIQIAAEPSQVDRIEEAVTSTALTVEYLSCLQELNTDTTES